MTPEMFRPLQDSDVVNIKVEELESMPANSNPYVRDSVRSGINLPKGWQVMFEMSKPGALEELILINSFSGQRIKLGFTPKYPQLADIIPSTKHRGVRAICGWLYMPDVHPDGIDWKCCDDIDVSDLWDSLYVLWWQGGDLYYVKAMLFIDQNRFPAEMKIFNGDDRLEDFGNQYVLDAAKVKATFDKYGPGPAPATANNVTAKPFGLNE